MFNKYETMCFSSTVLKAFPCILSYIATPPYIKHDLGRCVGKWCCWWRGCTWRRGGGGGAIEDLTRASCVSTGSSPMAISFSALEVLPRSGLFVSISFFALPPSLSLSLYFLLHLLLALYAPPYDLP